MGEGRINVAIAVSGVLALRRSTMAAFCFGNTTLLKSLWAGFFRRAPRAEPEHRDLSAALAMREAEIRASMGEIAAAIALCKEVLGMTETIMLRASCGRNWNFRASTI